MRFISVLSAAIILLTAHPSKADEPFNNADLARNFDVIAFGNEYTGERFPIVRKWKKPIRYGIQGVNYPAYLETFIEEFAGELRGLTHYPIELYYSFAKQKAHKLAPDFDKKNVNVILYYLPDSEIPAMLKKYWGGDEKKVQWMVQNSTCFANYFTKNDEIKAAVVIFPSRHPESYIRACVVEELTQILGLPNDSDDVKPSIFNDHSRYLELTEHDKWLVRALYQKDILPGMKREEAMTRVRAFFQRARPE